MILYGEDVAVYGGIFRVLAGLREEFGERVFDTPISENVIVGSAVGAAMAGLRPVAELQFADFIHCAADEVILKAGTWRYAHGGAFKLPLVIRAPSGGMGFGPEHSQCPEAYIMHSPGLRLAVPSTPADAKGLLKTAIRMDDPVIFFEHKLLYGMKGEVPDGEHLVAVRQSEGATRGIGAHDRRLAGDASPLARGRRATRQGGPRRRDRRSRHAQPLRPRRRSSPRCARPARAWWSRSRTARSASEPRSARC